MMYRKALLVLAFLPWLGANSGNAANTQLIIPLEAIAGGDQFILRETKGGFARLDRSTGAVGFCQKRGLRFVCKLSIEERQAYEVEIDRLNGKVDALQNEIAALRNQQMVLPPPAKEPVSEPEPDTEIAPQPLPETAPQPLPETAANEPSLAERALGKFADAVHSLRRELTNNGIPDGEAPAEPAPELAGPTQPGDGS